MNISTTLETNSKAAEVMQPGMRAFDDPAIFSETAAMFRTALGDQWLDTGLAQSSSMSLGVITTIGVDHTRPAQWMAAQSANRWNRVDQRQHCVTSLTFAPVRIAASGERRAVGVGDDVVLGTGSRAIGRVRPSF